MTTTSDRSATPAQLHAFCAACLQKLGVPGDQAETISASLIDADVRGIGTHGIVRLPQYAGRIRGGGLQPHTEISVIEDRPSVGVLDAHDGFGQVVAAHAMQLAIEKADQRGVAAVAVRRSNHVGVLGYYSRMAADRDMVGIALSGSAPSIAPWGGAEPLLGSNPWSVAYPTNRPTPFVVDISNGTVITGKLRAAQQRGEQLPPGWALDSDGRPTQDPAAGLAGSLMPFGGVKGAGLTLALEVLASILPGAAYSREIPELTDPAAPQRLGHLFLVLKTAEFMSPDDFRERVDEFLATIEGSRPVAGGPPVRVPGARGAIIANERAEGIPLPAQLAGQLDELAGDLGVEVAW